MPTLLRRAEGLSAGYGVLSILPWRLDPASELPGRRLPMSVVPPPERPLLQRILAAAGRLGATISAAAGLMVLAQVLAMPG